MNTPTGIRDICTRIATPKDIPFLAEHHRKMFEEIWEKSGLPVDLSQFALLETEYAKKIANEFKYGTCTSWVIQIGERIVSSGAISIVSYVPVPYDLSSRDRISP